MKLTWIFFSNFSVHEDFQDDILDDEVQDGEIIKILNDCSEEVHQTDDYFYMCQFCPMGKLVVERVAKIRVSNRSQCTNLCIGIGRYIGYRPIYRFCGYSNSISVSVIGIGRYQSPYRHIGSY